MGKYLLPSEAHPFEALLAAVGTVRTDELEEVVSFQVAGLLAVKLGLNHGKKRNDKSAWVVWVGGWVGRGAVL